jgi:hypothetical protein
MKYSNKQQNRKSPRKNQSRARQRRKITAPRTLKEFFVKPKSFQDTWTGVTHTISKMRADRVSLRQASRELGLDPRVVARLGKSALRKRKNGQYVARRSDKLLRILAVATPNGVREVAIRDSRQATQLGKYWAAVQKYLQTGDDSALKKFRRKRITDASGKKIPLVLDTGLLDQLGSAGVLSFETLYAKLA